MRLVKNFSLNKVAVANVLGALARFDVSGLDVLSVAWKNTGANPFNAFEVWGRAAPPGDGSDGLFVQLKATTYSDTTDFWIIKASSDPVALAPGASVLLMLNVGLLESVELRASAGSATIAQYSAGGYSD
jgi:hypothetical protein